MPPIPMIQCRRRDPEPLWPSFGIPLFAVQQLELSATCHGMLEIPGFTREVGALWEEIAAGHALAVRVLAASPFEDFGPRSSCSASRAPTARGRSTGSHHLPASKQLPWTPSPHGLLGRSPTAPRRVAPPPRLHCFGLLKGQGSEGPAGRADALGRLVSKSPCRPASKDDHPPA